MIMRKPRKASERRLAVVEEASTITPIPITNRIETLEDVLKQLEEVFVKPFGIMAQQYGDASSKEYHEPILDGYAKLWTWNFKMQGQERRGSLTFRISVHKSAEGTFVHPGISYSYGGFIGSIPDLTGADHDIEMAVSAKAPQGKATKARNIVAMILSDQPGILEVAYDPMTRSVSGLLYTAIRNSVRKAYDDFIEAQRTNAIGQILAAEAMRG